jgi:F420-dependent oxidoreductase-like protein
MKHPFRFGMQTGQQNVDFADVQSLWQKADGWGYDSLWAFDHLYPIFSDPNGPCLEGWTTLAALAQVTKKARIGHLVNGNTYRHPSLLAKMATTVDHISGGRLDLGIGAGWFELEHTSLGFDFKTVRGRLEALEESLQIITGMLAGEKVTLDGRHYRVNEAQCRPLPVQKKVPIMIGGTGKKILLRLVAQYADLWNAFATPEDMGRLIDVIRDHGDAIGRDTDEIEKTVMLPFCYTADKEKQDMMCGLLAAAFEVTPAVMRQQMMVGDQDECLDRIGKYAEQGVTHFIFMLMPPYPHDELQAFAEEVIPAAKAG